MDGGAPGLTIMELGKPLKCTDSVKNSVLCSSLPWPPYSRSSESSFMVYLKGGGVKEHRHPGEPKYCHTFIHYPLFFK